MTWCLVALGGAIGAVARFALSCGVARLHPSTFPWPTLVVNAIGSFLLTYGSVALVRRGVPHEWRMGFQVGTLGAFTTFSTFSYETLTLFEQRHYAMAVANVLASLLVCLLAGAAGFAAARSLT